MATAAVPIVNRKKIAPGKILINEKWRDARDGATMNTIDPTTEKVITSVAKASPADADEAVAAAGAAFEEGPWPKMHLEQRAKLLFRIADILDDRPEDFAIREAMDMGMPYRVFLRSSCRIAPDCFAFSVVSACRR